MTTALPSFQIEITEELSGAGKTIIHKLNMNTARICKEVNAKQEAPEAAMAEEEVIALIGEQFPKPFYTKIATQLSALDREKLLEHFADLRICFRATKSQKNYHFQF